MSRCQSAVMICAAVGKSGRLVDALMVEEDLVVQLLALSSTGRLSAGRCGSPHSRPGGRADGAVVDGEQGLRGRAAAERSRLRVVQEPEHDVLRPVDAEQRADGLDAALERWQLPFHVVQDAAVLGHRVGHLRDHGPRVELRDRGRALVHLARCGGQDLARLQDRGEVEATRRGVACELNEPASAAPGSMTVRDIRSMLSATVRTPRRFSPTNGIASPKRQSGLPSARPRCSAEALSSEASAGIDARSRSVAAVWSVETGLGVLEVGAHRHRVVEERPGRQAPADEDQRQDWPDDGVHDPALAPLGLVRGAHARCGIFGDLESGHSALA